MSKYNGLTRAQYREVQVRAERAELAALRANYRRLFDLAVALLNALDPERRQQWEAEVLSDGGLVTAQYEEVARA